MQETANVRSCARSWHRSWHSKHHLWRCVTGRCTQWASEVTRPMMQDIHQGADHDWKMCHWQVHSACVRSYSAYDARHRPGGRSWLKDVSLAGALSVRQKLLGLWCKTYTRRQIMTERCVTGRCTRRASEVTRPMMQDIDQEADHDWKMCHWQVHSECVRSYSAYVARHRPGGRSWLKDVSLAGALRVRQKLLGLCCKT